MSEATGVRVNLCNPGEFLACCGLLETAWRATGGAAPPTGSFEGNLFALNGTALSARDLVARVIAQEPTVLDTDGSANALAPLMLSDLGLRLDWWRQPGNAKEPWQKTPFKLWAGQQTSANIWTALRDAIRALLSDKVISPDRLLACRAMLTGRFGFDPEAAWNALDAGFSPNEQGYEVASGPIVELLAAIGIQRFRPVPTDDRDTFEYVAWTTPLPASIASAAASGCIADPQARCFRFRVASRGSYGCFATATEIRRTR